MPEFIPGLQLARDFYFETVRGLIDVPHAPALLGEGSEVLGFDQRAPPTTPGGRDCRFVDAAEIGMVNFTT